MSRTTLSPDEAAAHMYPSDLKKFEFGEHVADAFSIAVGCPDEASVPLFTTAQAETYANARVREALVAYEGVLRHALRGLLEFDRDSVDLAITDAARAIRALLPSTPAQLG